MLVLNQLKDQEAFESQYLLVFLEIKCVLKVHCHSMSSKYNILVGYSIFVVLMFTSATCVLQSDCLISTYENRMR